MPRTNEVAFNVELSNVLRTKHPRWRDHIRAEQQAVVRAAAKRPDIIIHPPGSIPVVLETEFEPARSVEEDAQARLGQVLQLNGDRIEQTIAVRIPKALSQKPQAALKKHIEAAKFRYAQTRDGRLYVSLWWGITDSAPPLTMQVERSDPPCCTVKIADSVGLDEIAAAEAGELERYAGRLQ